MELHRISDVVTAINTIVQTCEQTQNRAGYFAALYKRMTVAVAEGIAAGAFEDGTRMEKLDIVFARRYLDAWQAYGQKEGCSTSWKYAFDGCLNQSLTVIQQLVLGINTHINLDLAIAAAAVAPGSQIQALKNDFDRINNVIASLVDDIQKCLEEVWLPMRWLTRVAATQQASVLNFSIGVARKTAWTNAMLLANMNAAQQRTHIATMDMMVYNLARKIINPGLGPELLLSLIRRTEYADVARTIRLIDTTVVA
ncbi:DUF5995 family protein [Hymenobacter sp. GOD-10R]|uniref:DUF5995 family protein n=1 Tax=Hymenobacter sp. GOD-10R TaxID=3093922 RepID=UPI002D7753F0|nr:DUF5995 family protein [Hymenobacter sp. GOD-10R]WRQ31016.1 DUF5995 family protein [Hymenobacter sp. GOD-10R]